VQSSAAAVVLQGGVAAALHASRCRAVMRAELIHNMVGSAGARPFLLLGPLLVFFSHLVLLVTLLLGVRQRVLRRHSGCAAGGTTRAPWTRPRSGSWPTW
jgi:hypothetical protein